MPGRRRSNYGSSSSSEYYGYGRDKQRRLPSPLPYLVVALLAAGGLAYFHLFVFQSLSGKVTNAYTKAPIAGAVLSITSASTTQATPQASPAVVMTATTAPDGGFSFEKIPPAPVVSLDVDGFAPQTITVAGKSALNIELVPDILRGQVLTPDGKAVEGATIFDGQTSVRTGADGSYVFKGVTGDRKLVVKAPGYLSASVQITQVVTQNVTLQPFSAKAIYISADSLATPAKRQALFDLIDRTELNAVVIDVKADNTGMVLYNSKLPLVEQLATVYNLIPDLGQVLATLKSKQIYTIARLSVFWDQAATAARPEWALKSRKAPGQPWTDSNGKRWTNPFSQEVWDYNISIAAEVAALGFNEVLFDNTQFPSDGDLADLDFGPEAAGKRRVDAIAGFLDRAYKQLSPLGVYVADNVFGLTPFVDDDMGVGQHFEDVAAHVDYISPTIYPSNYGDGFMDFAHPAEHPLEIVSGTMRAAVARLAGSSAKVRPWLQDFSSSVAYDAPKVRGEIDGAEQNGAVGWMLWNFGNVYTEAALKGQ